MQVTDRFGAPPPSSLVVEPTPADVERFRRDGFLVVERITTDEELDWLTGIFEAVFEQVDERPEAHPNRGNQSMFPELAYPALLETTFARNARRVAAALLGVDGTALSSWSHFLRKPVGTSRLAPWHQDEAYWEPELAYHALGAWLPLHAVSVERGAMQFIPGSHRLGVLPHHFHGGDPVDNLLEVDDGPEVDRSTAVPCPLPAGGATFHSCRTLHFTAPNTTAQPRLACATEWQVAPTRRDVPAVRRWVDERRAVASHRPMVDAYLADGQVLPVG